MDVPGYFIFAVIDRTMSLIFVELLSSSKWLQIRLTMLHVYLKISYNIKVIFWIVVFISGGLDKQHLM